MSFVGERDDCFLKVVCFAGERGKTNDEGPSGNTETMLILELTGLDTYNNNNCIQPVGNTITNMNRYNIIMKPDEGNIMDRYCMKISQIMDKLIIPFHEQVGYNLYVYTCLTYSKRF